MADNSDRANQRTPIIDDPQGEAWADRLRDGERHPNPHTTGHDGSSREDTLRHVMTRRDVAAYIQDMVSPLETIASQQNLPVLAHMLAMVREQAADDVSAARSSAEHG